MRPVLHWRGVAYPSRKVTTSFPTTWKDLSSQVFSNHYLTWRVYGIASSIKGIFLHHDDHFAMIGVEEGSTGNNV